MSILNQFFITTSNKQFIIYSTITRTVLLNKRLDLKNILKILYSKRLRAIILLTHNQNIPVLKLENKKKSFELNFVGRLIGHLSLVVEGCFMEEKGILASIDETVWIKFWNLQKMTCLKSI